MTESQASLTKPEKNIDDLNNDLKMARHEFVKSKYGVFKRFIGTPNTPEKIEAKRKYDEALSDYKNIKLKELKKAIEADPRQNSASGNSGKTKGEILTENTMRELTSGEFLNLQNEELNIKEEELRSGSIKGRLLSGTQAILDKYASSMDYLTQKIAGGNAGFIKKIAASGTIGLAANIASGGIAWLPMRILGGTVAAERYKKMADLYAEKKINEQNETSIQKNLSEARRDSEKFDFDLINNWLDDQTSQLSDKFNRYKNKDIVRTAGAITAAFGISYATHEIFKNATNWFDSNPAEKSSATETAEIKFPIHYADLTQEQLNAQAKELFGSLETVKYISELPQIEKSKIWNSFINAGKIFLDTSGSQEAMQKNSELMGQHVNSIIDKNKFLSPDTTRSDLNFTSSILNLVNTLTEKLGPDGSPKENEELKHYMLRTFAEAHEKNIDIEKFTKETNHSLLDHSTSSASIENPPTQIIHTAAKGENLWKIIDQKLGEYPELSDEGRRTHAIDAIKDKFAHMSPEELKTKIGISSGNIDQLAVGDKVNLTPIMADTDIMPNIIHDAGSISDATAHQIENNNAKIEKFFSSHPDIQATEDNIDKVLRDQADSLVHSKTESPTPHAGQTSSETPNQPEPRMWHVPEIDDPKHWPVHNNGDIHYPEPWPVDNLTSTTPDISTHPHLDSQPESLTENANPENLHATNDSYFDTKYADFAQSPQQLADKLNTTINSFVRNQDGIVTQINNTQIPENLYNSEELAHLSNSRTPSSLNTNNDERLAA